MRSKSFRRVCINHSFTYMLVCCSIIACNQAEPTLINEEEDCVQIGADIAMPTKATDAGFEQNDTLGIYITKWQDASTPAGLLPTANYKDNAWFRLSNLPNDWIPENTIYYPADDSKIDLHAYYPYRNPSFSSGTSLSLTVAPDQSAYRDYTRSDFMVAKANGVKRTSQKVQLTFDHKLSQMVFQLKPGAGFTANELLVAKVKVVNAITDATYDLAGGATPLTAGNTRKDITPCGSWAMAGDSLNGVMAIVVPQEINQTTYIQVSLGNRKFTFKPQPIQMTSGCSRKFTITVNNTGLDITTTITPWNNCPPVSGNANEEFNDLETIFGPFNETISGDKSYPLSRDFVLATGRPFRISGTYTWHSCNFDIGRSLEMGKTGETAYLYMCINTTKKEFTVFIKRPSDRSKDIFINIPMYPLIEVDYHIVVDYDGSQLTVNVNGNTAYQGTPEFDTVEIPTSWLGGSALYANGDCRLTYNNFTIEN